MSVVPSIEPVSLSEAIVEKVADREGVEPTELAPLYDVIDPDALDRLVESAKSRDSALRVEFSYHGYSVTVTAEGVVDVDERLLVQG